MTENELKNQLKELLKSDVPLGEQRISKQVKERVLTVVQFLHQKQQEDQIIDALRRHYHPASEKQQTRIKSVVTEFIWQQQQHHWLDELWTNLAFG